MVHDNLRWSSLRLEANATISAAYQQHSGGTLPSLEPGRTGGRFYMMDADMKSPLNTLAVVGLALDGWPTLASFARVGPGQHIDGPRLALLPCFL